MSKITLHVQTDPCTSANLGKEVKIVGEVKDGEEVLHTIKDTAYNAGESVPVGEEHVKLGLELWAVQNTDFMPEDDCLAQ